MFVVFGLPYGVIGIYDTAIGQGFISANLPKVASIIPNWLPPIWFFLGIIAILFFTFEGAYRIVHKSEKKQDKAIRTLIRGIESDILSGKILLEKLKKAPQSDKNIITEWDEWVRLVGECMQREQYSEWFDWFNAIHISQPTLSNMIVACDKGISQLLDIHRRLANSLTSAKKDSQK